MIGFKRFVEDYWDDHLQSQKQSNPTAHVKRMEWVNGLRKSIRPNDKIIFNNSPSPAFNVINKGSLGQGAKPRGGIWYGCGVAWINFILGDLWGDDHDPYLSKYNFAHLINIDTSKVFSPKSSKEWFQFEDQYGNESGDSINWDQVAQQYMGVDLCQWFSRVGLLYAWDVSSGVFWNSQAVLNSKTISVFR